MASFALITTDLVVERVIVASPAWVREEMPAWMRAPYAHVVEVHAPGEAPETDDAIETRDCEPGSTYEPTTRSFARPQLEGI